VLGTGFSEGLQFCLDVRRPEATFTDTKAIVTLILKRLSKEVIAEGTRITSNPFPKKKSSTLSMTVTTPYTNGHKIQPGDNAESNQRSIHSGSFPGMLTVNGAVRGLL
jgi:hypothetical protein